MMEWVLLEFPNADQYTRQVHKTFEYTLLVASSSKPAFPKGEGKFLANFFLEWAQTPTGQALASALVRSTTDNYGSTRVLWSNELFCEESKDYPRFPAPLTAKLVERLGIEVTRNRIVESSRNRTFRQDKLEHELAHELTLFQTDLEKRV